eukprot:COSAG01_NODE_541_length_15735_cov_4.534088_4_plen_351_part_00
MAMPVAQPPMGGAPVAVAQPISHSGAQQPTAMAAAQPPMGGLPGTVAQPISHSGTQHSATMAVAQPPMGGLPGTVAQPIGHSGAQQPTVVAVAQPPMGGFLPTSAGYAKSVVTIAPARRNSSSSDDEYDIVALVEAEVDKLCAKACGRCESCLAAVYMKVLAPCLRTVWICLRAIWVCLCAVYDKVLAPCLRGVWTCLLAVWKHPVGKVLLTLGGWLVPNFKNEYGDSDTNRSKCLGDDPDAAYSCIRECGKMPLVGGPIVTFALPSYLVCKAMIWLWDKVVAPCLRAVWKTCLSPCLLAVWRTCLSPCLLKLHKVLAPCLPWVCCCIQTANRAMQIVDIAHMSDSSDSD